MRRAGEDDTLLKKVAGLYPQQAGKDQIACVEKVVKECGDASKEQMYNAWMLASFNSYADNDTKSALYFAKKASDVLQGDQGVVASYSVEWLSQKVGAEGAVAVYDDSKGFELFCDAGSNVPLYVETSAALVEEIRACKHDEKPLSMLEIGVGAGRAFIPVAKNLCCGDSPVLGNTVLVEPSDMINTCQSALKEQCGESVMDHMKSFQGTLKSFASSDMAGDTVWDVAETTFALQSIPRDERKKEALPWLYDHVKTLLVVEFDVPAEWAADPIAPASIVHVMQCYRDTLLTYTEEGGQRGIVARGFLIPVMYGYISRDSSKKTNEEIPIDDWVDDLRAAGFADIRVRDLFKYEWSPAKLIIAKKK